MSTRRLGFVLMEAPPGTTGRLFCCGGAPGRKAGPRYGSREGKIAQRRERLRLHLPAARRGEDVFVEDFFVRHSAAAPEFGILYEGERVVYQAAWDEWGPKAENVCVILSSRPTHR